ncbi:hypothetical protein [Couchioplanes caeruleus]|uniref:hypothetical protein n=1 Tax=Couchioplanes caeruleus TaxID=56438 RepID=UPI000AF1CDCC|nr:hypothetical protein [Couchioplanes caeruleus]
MRQIRPQIAKLEDGTPIRIEVIDRELQRRVEHARTELAARPDGIKFGKFPPGRPHDDNNLPPGLAAVLPLSDGPRGGEIVVYSHAELAQQQHFSLEGVEAVADPPVWTRFATLNDEPYSSTTRPEKSGGSQTPA